MIISVEKSDVPIMVGFAAFLVVAGLAIWWYYRRKGERGVGLMMLVGFPGLYIGLLAALGAISKWFNILAAILVVASYAVQFAYQRKGRANPPNKQGPA
jgi:hypothetical protein